jgi:RNA polymerase sigma factor (sigma-70 family)
VESDSQLVAGVLAGERAVFADLVRRHERSVRAVAFAVLGEHEAARDTAQEAFLQAFQKLGSLRDAGAFGPWVRTIARNRASTHARRRVTCPSLEEVGDLPCVAVPPLDNELARLLVEAVAQLPEHEQAVVMLYYFGDHSVTAIARIVGRPVGTITMQLSRARQRLREWLKEQAP